MDFRGAPDLGQPGEDPGGQRAHIRQRMRTVIGQLEGILRELKQVARELREVVSQIDRLTSDFDFELEPDDWATATGSSTSSSERTGAERGRLDSTAGDVLSDSWEFCCFPDVPSAPAPGFLLMNGGLPVPNGPRVGTPDAASGDAFGGGPPPRPPGTRERVRFSDKVLYHALCCDDEGAGCPAQATDDGGAPPQPPRPAPARPRRPPGPALGRRGTRDSSTQTVSDKSTQTAPCGRGQS
ncbi:inhibitory synaptic factor 1 [Erinaceus europaeus]|uniref:Inhibitory synaptic factor 1 n=1 Tax=Erinaceus europaeus TaxID=9365 RepID=A0ABM3W4S5_ERIEU|nr:inhibitory synaptic factor 1 [Erinaceus europaeus]